MRDERARWTRRKYTQEFKEDAVRLILEGTPIAEVAEKLGVERIASMKAHEEQLLARHGLRQSMSARGNCYDNATMESFFGTFKAEEGEMFPDAPRARLAVFDYIETFHDGHRIHTSLDGCSPAEFERRHHANPDPAPRPAASEEFFEGIGCSAGGRGSGSEPESRSGSPDSHDRSSHHPDYPLEGCSPAEPSSVSPGRHQQDPHSDLAQSKTIH